MNGHDQRERCVSDENPVLVDLVDGIAQVTLNRPDVRNAISPEMRKSLWRVLSDLETDDAAEVMILTGADPAFCAGLDLKILGSNYDRQLASVDRGSVNPFPPRTKPLIGAINGAAITGGFELALNCDFLIASERAAFADTHARVGVMPGWGLTPLLTDAVGRTRAREISLTGNFVSAEQALQWGLVNRVVPHHDLLPTVRQIAADIVGNDQLGVRQMLATYAVQEADSLGGAWDRESEGSRQFSTVADPGAEVESRRQAIIERGRSQL